LKFTLPYYLEDDMDPTINILLRRLLFQPGNASVLTLWPLYAYLNRKINHSPFLLLFWPQALLYVSQTGAEPLEVINHLKKIGRQLVGLVSAHDRCALKWVLANGILRRVSYDLVCHQLVYR